MIKPFAGLTSYWRGQAAVEQARHRIQTLVWQAGSNACCESRQISPCSTIGSVHQYDQQQYAGVCSWCAASHGFDTIT